MTSPEQRAQVVVDALLKKPKIAFRVQKLLQEHPKLAGPWIEQEGVSDTWGHTRISGKGHTAATILEGMGDIETSFTVHGEPGKDPTARGRTKTVEEAMTLADDALTDDGWLLA